MLKLRALTAIVVAALGITLVLTGCGAKPNPAPATPPTTQQPAPDTGAIKTGAAQMRTLLAEMNQALAAQDAAKAKGVATELEQSWEKFEDAVKAQDKARYEQVEQPLGAIQGGVKVSPLDTKTLGDQVQKLDAVLADLAK